LLLYLLASKNLIKYVKMKKIWLLFPVFWIFNVATAGCQTNDSCICAYYDLEKYISVSEIQYPDSNTFCLDLNGAVSAKILDEFISGYPYKEKITLLSINNYVGKAAPAAITDLKNLTTISLVNCPDLKYKKFFHYLGSLPALRVLKLDENESADIPSTISELDNLKMLWVTNYEFVDGAKLMENISQLQNLEQLTLSSVNTLELNNTVPLPKNLRKLDLSDNWLEDLPDNMNNLQKLNSLNISENDFDNIEKLIKKIDSLPIKYFSINCFTRKDSVLLAKKFPQTDLQISVYRDPEKINAGKKNIRPQLVPVSIGKFYGNKVVPPIGNPETVRKKYTIKPIQSSTLSYTSGTTISIPENAFVDLKGNTVTEDVNLYYREYNDIVDILANGVPMAYDSAGQQYFFRTSGMFEIYAFKDNEMLSMAPGKNITFDFAALDTTSGYNLYRLDEKTGNWDFTTPLQNNFIKKERKLSNAYRMYNELNNFNFDTTRFAERYNDSLYAHTKKIPWEYFKGRKRLLEPYFKIKRIYKYSSDKEIKKATNFILYFKKYQMFTELNAFKGYVWVYSGPLSKKDFVKKFISHKKWTDTRIDYDEAGNIFTIELKSPHEVVSMEAFPIKSKYTTERKNYIRTYTRLDTRYTKSLNKYGMRFDKNINRKMARHQRKIWNRISAAMSEEEKTMSRDEWLDYAKARFENEKRDLEKIQSSFTTVTQSFQIDGFGIWNCDQILRLRNPVQITAQFKNQFDQNINVKKVSVIDARIKAILTYIPDEDKTKMSLDPTSETAIFLIGENGSIALIDKESVKNVLLNPKNHADYTFKAYETDPSDISTSEMRRMLGL